MPTETQEIQYDNLRVHSGVAEKFRGVWQRYREKNRVSATQSEVLEKMTEFYAAHELKDAA